MKSDIYNRYNIPERITVSIDTREQYPLLFPSTIHLVHPELTFNDLPVQVDTEKVPMHAGDYGIQGYEHICLVERKASQLELFKNFTDPRDRVRQAKAFRKLTGACQWPILLVEASPGELLSRHARVKRPEVICSQLGLAAAKYGLHVVVIPWKSRSSDVRRKLGTFVLHMMLGKILQTSYEMPVQLLAD